MLGGGGGTPVRSAGGVFAVADGAGSGPGSTDDTGRADPADGAAPDGGAAADSDAGSVAAGPSSVGAGGLAPVDVTPTGAAAVVPRLTVGTGGAGRDRTVDGSAG